MTQRDRVLAASRGFNGVCQTDFLLPAVCDGGPPITRVGARLYELDQAGFSFECIGRRNKCKVFRLIDEPQSAQPGPTPGPSQEQGQHIPDRPIQQGAQGELDGCAGTLFEIAGESTPHWRAA